MSLSILHAWNFWLRTDKWNEFWLLYFRVGIKWPFKQLVVAILLETRTYWQMSPYLGPRMIASFCSSMSWAVVLSASSLSFGTRTKARYMHDRAVLVYVDKIEPFFPRYQTVSDIWRKKTRLIFYFYFSGYTQPFSGKMRRDDWVISKVIWQWDHHKVIEI